MPPRFPAQAGRTAAILLPMSIRLHAGERVLFEGHPSWRAMLAWYLKGILAAAVLGLLIQLVFSDSGLTFAIVLAGVVVTVVVGFIRRMATTYTITDRRLNIKRGIFAREIQETRLERVQNVNYSQGVIQRLLQVGDVDFDTASSGNDYTFVFAGVADPGDVVHRVDEATGAARLRAAAGDDGL